MSKQFVIAALLLLIPLHASSVEKAPLNSHFQCKYPGNILAAPVLTKEGVRFKADQSKVDKLKAENEQIAEWVNSIDDPTSKQEITSRLLSEKSFDACRAVAGLAQRAADPNVQAFLFELLNSNDEILLRATYKALSTALSDTPVREAYYKGMADPTHERHVYHLLFRQSSEAVVKEFLESAQSHTSKEVRSVAIRAYAYGKKASTIPALKSIFNSELSSDEDRLVVVDALAARKIDRNIKLLNPPGADDYAADAAAKEVLFEISGDESQTSTIRFRALSRLARFEQLGDEVKELALRLSSHSDQYIRSAAVDTLVQFSEDPEVLKLFLAMPEDAKKFQRYSRLIFKALEPHVNNSEEVLNLFIESVVNGNVHTASNAASALKSNSHIQRVRNVLLDCTKSEDINLKRACWVGLEGAVEFPEVKAEHLRILRDSSEESRLRLMSLRILEKALDIDATIALLYEINEDPDPTVQRSVNGRIDLLERKRKRDNAPMRSDVKIYPNSI